MTQLLESDEHGRLTLSVDESTSYAVVEAEDGRVVLQRISDAERHLLSRPDLMTRLEQGIAEIEAGLGTPRVW